MNDVSKEFIEYFNDYLLEDLEDGFTTYDGIMEEMGNWCCKYCDDQDEVNTCLDEIDEVLSPILEKFY